VKFEAKTKSSKAQARRASSRSAKAQARSFKKKRVPSVGIQKHFMGAEIPGFGLPNWFSGLTTSCFFRDGIGKLIFNKVQ
jgi:hypothetical protein